MKRSTLFAATALCWTLNAGIAPGQTPGPARVDYGLQFGHNGPTILNNSGTLNFSAPVGAQNLPQPGVIVSVAPPTGVSSTDDTSLSNAVSQLTAFNGGELLLDAGTYTVAAVNMLPNNTTVECAPSTVIQADIAANWPGGSIGGVFAASGESNITVEGCDFVWPSTNNSPHILQWTNTNNVRILNNTSTGAGDFDAFIGGSVILEQGDVVSNVANSCFDHWGANLSTVRVSYTFCSTNSGTNAGLGAIQFTAVSQGGTAATSPTNFFADHNLIVINNSGAGQGVEINGYTGGGSGGLDCFVDHNEIWVGTTNSAAHAWGVLVNHGGCSYIDIDHNHFHGDNYTPASESAVAIQDTLTLFGKIEFNLAWDWTAASTNGVFENKGLFGTDIGNQCDSTCVGSLNVDSASILDYGNGNGTGTFTINSPLSLTSLSVPAITGAVDFTGAVSITGTGSLTNAGTSTLNGPVLLRQGLATGFNTAGGIVNTINGAAGTVLTTNYQNAGVNNWKTGEDAVTDFYIEAWTGSGLTCRPFQIANSNGAVSLGCAGQAGNAVIMNAPPIDEGTQFSITGCGVIAGSRVGGGRAGKFTLAGNSCNVTITLAGAVGATAPNGWDCYAHDLTTPTNAVLADSSSTTATAIFAIPAWTNTDVVQFSCVTGF